MNTQPVTRITPIHTALLLRQMVAASGQDMPLAHSLARRAGSVVEYARAERLEIPVIGSAPLFEEVRLVTRTRPAWALYNLSRDPLYLAGRFPVPARHLRRMRRMEAAGIQFDAVYVAHELPDDFRPGQDPLTLQVLAPEPPTQAVTMANHLGLATDRILSVCAALAGAPFALLATAGAGISAVLRDPVLMGALVPPGVNPDPGVPAIWFLLAAWRW
jgi:hypothetical protein